MTLQSIRKYAFFVKAIFSAFSIIYLTNIGFSSPTVVYLFLFFALLMLFRHPYAANTTYPESRCVALILSLFVFFGEHWLDQLFGNTSIRGVLFPLIASVGIYILFERCLNTFYTYCKENLGTSFHCRKQKFTPRQVFLVSFCMLWVVYFLFFLNQYPGSLSCDTPTQLAQAMGDLPFENANPLINTLVITLFVKLGLLIGNSVNLGIAFYTFFQFSLCACVFAYTIAVLYKIGTNKWILLFSQAFYNFVPYNIIYANGMWKDTFFAIFFLATLAYTCDYLYSFASSKHTPSRGFSREIILFTLVLIASLARNSGWSSLLVLGIALLIFAAKRKKRQLSQAAKTIILGVVSALAIISYIYPALGVTNHGGTVSAVSVPIQQISRVIAHDGDISAEEATLINNLVPLKHIKQGYDPTLSDPIKFAINNEKLEKDLSVYAKVWIQLAIKNPKRYLDAFLELTECYWYLKPHVWIHDTRIFDNPYGVVRTPLLMPDVNAVQALNDIIDFPKEAVLYTSSIILWIAIIMCGCSGVTKNRLGLILITPIFAIFIGLLFTSPAALFRYTYGAAVCLPLIVSVPFTSLDT